MDDLTRKSYELRRDIIEMMHNSRAGHVGGDLSVIDILAVLQKSGLAPSRAEARRNVEQGGVSVKGEKVTDIKASYTKDIIGAEEFIVKKGKKSFKKIVVE